ncbi:MAG: malate synthase A [Chloroflexota bacterium]
MSEVADIRDELNRRLESDGIIVRGRVTPTYAEILSPDALRFVAVLHREFNPTRKRLLQRRAEIQAEINAGKLPDFLAETAEIRQADWQVAPEPPDLRRRWVEITGPVDRKMIINALNSGADVYMADFEDAFSPTWAGTVEGQVNLRDAVDGTIEYVSPDGRLYRLAEKTAVLMVRPRGWHLEEKHVLVDGEPVSASLFDFGLFFYHNARKLIAKGTGPYFYIPKLENHLEARLWNDVFNRAQDMLGIRRGTVKATVLIETILAAFEMDEILYELRDHSVGLNFGRWDYIFSFIKKFFNFAEYVFPDRAQVTMDKHFLRSLALLLVNTCHRRGAHAIGGMAAQIPARDPEVNERNIAKVREDKDREISQGFDGTWVAHPWLVPVVREMFEQRMPGPDQRHLVHEGLQVTAADLLKVPEGDITEGGLRTNVNVGVRYLESWLRGIGAASINYLMEDTATVEICRAQVQQWLRHRATLKDGRPVTAELVRQVFREELDRIRSELGDEGWTESKFELAARILLDEVILRPDFVEFLPLVAYEYLD